MKLKQLLTKTLLVVAVCLLGGASSVWADTTIFSAVATNALSVTAETSNQEITSTNATISGGTMYVYNGQSSVKNLISSASGTQGFTLTNGNTFFKVTLPSALEEGDKINFKTFNNDKSNSADRGLWFTSTEGYPASAPTANKTASIASNSWSSTLSYTVAIGDGICGESTFYIYRAVGKTSYFTDFTITRATAAPGAISFSPAAGSVAVGTSVTLTSSGATTIVYQWGASAVDGEGDWSTVETYSDSNKPVVPAAGSTNTVLSVKATNANGSTYGSASYTPVKMAMKTIYSFADGIGSQTVTAGTASVESSPMSLGNTAGRIKLTPATGFKFKNGDAIEFSGSIGNTAKAYGIKYGPTTSLGIEDLFVAAGQPCHVSGTLSLASDADNLFIGRYDGTTTNFNTFTVRRLTAATSEAFTGTVKINGSAVTEDVDYTKAGNVFTLTDEYATMPTVYLVNHIVFADESTEDQNVLVAFGAPDGEYFTGTAEIDGTTYTVKAPCGQINALKVVYKESDTTVKEENLDVTDLKVGATYSAPYRMYVMKDGKLYNAAKQGSGEYYKKSITLEFNTTVTINVTAQDIPGEIVFFEDFDGESGENAFQRASNGLANNNTEFTSEDDLPAGVYNFIVRAQNKGRSSSVKIGETTVFSISDVNASTNTWTDKTISDVNVPTAGKLAFVKGGANSIDCYDIVIAIKQKVSGTITDAGWSSFASSKPLDLSTLTATSGATAYYASNASGSTVTLTSTTATVPAGEGLMIKGTAGETFTIDVAASGDAISGNLLKGQTTTGNVDASNKDSNGKYHYVFGYKKPADVVTEYGFYNLASDTSVPAGKAYLETTTALTAGARSLSIVFDDETTDISEKVIVKSEGFAAAPVYDLLGRRVAQPTKGLYIVNGKKVVIK